MWVKLSTEFFRNHKLAEIPADRRLPAAALFIELLGINARNGRDGQIPASACHPAILQGALHLVMEGQVHPDTLLDDLAQAGFILVTDEYVSIVGWDASWAFAPSGAERMRKTRAKKKRERDKPGDKPSDNTGDHAVASRDKPPLRSPRKKARKLDDDVTDTSSSASELADCTETTVDNVAATALGRVDVADSTSADDGTKTETWSITERLKALNPTEDAIHQVLSNEGVMSRSLHKRIDLSHKLAKEGFSASVIRWWLQELSQSVSRGQHQRAFVSECEHPKARARRLEDGQKALSSETPHKPLEHHFGPEVEADAQNMLTDLDDEDPQTKYRKLISDRYATIIGDVVMKRDSDGNVVTSDRKWTWDMVPPQFHPASKVSVTDE